MISFPQADSSIGRWTAIRTKPRCEKQLCRFAEARNIPYYLPLLRRRKRYQRRQVETLIPMFPGYIFAQIGNHTTQILFESNRVARILPINTDAEETGLLQELQSIRVFEQAELEKELIVNPEILPGSPVLISEGPLQGCRGIVEKRDDQARVTINLELLGSSVTAIINLHEVAIDIDD